MPRYVISLEQFDEQLDREIGLEELVMCKDCIHNYHNMIPCPENWHECAEFIELPITGDFYCAKGERKEDAKTD